MKNWENHLHPWRKQKNEIKKKHTYSKTQCKYIYICTHIIYIFPIYVDTNANHFCLLVTFRVSRNGQFHFNSRRERRSQWIHRRICRIHRRKSYVFFASILGEIPIKIYQNQHFWVWNPMKSWFCCFDRHFFSLFFDSTWGHRPKNAANACGKWWFHLIFK